jgi:hypothetical protein
MYQYELEKPKIFTEEGARVLLTVRDHVARMLTTSGAFMLAKAFDGVQADTWLTIACVEFLAEIGEIHEVPRTNVTTQHRIFVR